MKNAGVLEYNKKRVKFDKDSYLVEKVLKSRLDLIEEKKQLEDNTVKINELINEAKK